jgi:hypothetical protein
VSEAETERIENLQREKVSVFEKLAAIYTFEEAENENFGL